MDDRRNLGAPESLSAWLLARRAEQDGVSYRQMSARTGGALTAGRIHQIATGQGPKRPTLELLRDLARAVCDSADEGRLEELYADLWLVAFGATVPNGLILVADD